MAALKTYRFKGRLERMPGRGGMYYVVFPYDVEKEFGTRGSVRVLGRINDIDVDRALIPRGDGSHHILINTELRRRAGLREGNELTVALRLNQHPEDLAIPEELAEAFALEPEAESIFNLLNTGTRRGIIYWLNSAKRTETRAQRAGEILQRLVTGYFSRPPK